MLLYTHSGDQTIDQIKVRLFIAKCTSFQVVEDAGSEESHFENWDYQSAHQPPVIDQTIDPPIESSNDESTINQVVELNEEPHPEPVVAELKPSKSSLKKANASFNDKLYGQCNVSI